MVWQQLLLHRRHLPSTVKRRLLDLDTTRPAFIAENSAKFAPVQFKGVVDENVASATRPGHDKTGILHVERNSREVRPGAVQVRGISYRSGLSSPSYDEEHNNESMQPVVEQRFSLPETLVQTRASFQLMLSMTMNQVSYMKPRLST